MVRERERVRHGLTLVAAAAANGSCPVRERAQQMASGKRLAANIVFLQAGKGGRPMDALRAGDMLAVMSWTSSVRWQWFGVTFNGGSAHCQLQEHSS